MSRLLGLLKQYGLIDIKWVVISLLVGIAAYFIVRKFGNRRHLVIVPVLSAYLFLMLSYLVFARHGSGYHDYQLIPFWSYKWFIVSKKLVFISLVNVAIYIPLGLGFPVIMRSYRKAIGLGFLFSLLVNVLQFVTTTGAFEFDDIFHNTVGVCIGCICCEYARRWYHNRLINKQYKSLTSQK